ncbi:helix-turn-helix domain-containing protein [Paenibacillus sp. CAU 1782]
MQLSTLQTRLGKLLKQSVSAHAYRHEVIALLRSVLSFDAACCTSVDPLTLLSTGAMTEEGLESIHARLLQSEFGSEDINAYHRLAASPLSVASLYAATEGKPEKSPRYREVLHPAGFSDELRAALLCDSACWGYLTLFRSSRQEPFTEDELALIAALSPAIAHGLRSFTLTLPATSGAVGSNNEPGILMLSEQAELLTWNKPAEDWLRLLREWENITEETLPRPVLAISAKVGGSSYGNDGDGKSARVTIRVPDGTYLSIRGSRLRDTKGGNGAAIIVEPAKPADMLPLLSKAYGLSPRESDIAELVFRGASTKEIADILFISSYTVQDHLKSIFLKTNVHSRRELIWQLFTRFAAE